MEKDIGYYGVAIKQTYSVRGILAFFFAFFLAAITRSNKKGVTSGYPFVFALSTYVTEYRSQQYLEWFELSGKYHRTELS